MIEHNYAIIVAGGKGTRFSDHTPKQFIDLNGKPVIVHTVERFRAAAEAIRIIVVLPADDLGRWEEVASRYNLKKEVSTCIGGSSRSESVRNGLHLVEGDGLVAIHDGVRPLVSEGLIKASFAAARQYGAAVPAVELKDSIREVSDAGSSRALSRSTFRLVQTPQTFKVSIIRQAYAMAGDNEATDDATLVEQAGFPVHLIPGQYANIKITTPEDLIIASTLMMNQGH